MEGEEKVERGGGPAQGDAGEVGRGTRGAFLPLEDLLYWMEREEGCDSEPLGYLGAHFPTGCRYCI
ncbi:MAG: hypothetical protein HPY75_02790 [Actinobacteria bacterium]|nr:hypothetical protein [Actinomycetota bacterium]